MKEDAAEPDPDKVHLTTRVVKQSDESAIVDEARKGFDLMLAGLAETHDAQGVFNAAVTRLARNFEGPLALLAASAATALPALTGRLRILVPINGTSAARHAAEVAFAIARPIGAHVTALYVSAGADASRRGRAITRNQEEAVLKDIADLGERYAVTLRTALQPKTAADAAILKNAGNGYGLIVMGVSRRPGEQLFFGNTAGAILKNWNGAILFVAS